nr:hypothetical protein [Mycobacterium sp.]
MRILSGFATAALWAAVATGCSGAPEQPAPDVSAPPAEVHRDIAGLAKEFPGIGAPESVVWLQWDDPAAGDAETGVSWTDAVVRLTPTVAEAMVAQFEPTDTGRAPRVQDVLQPEVPKGPFLTGVLLDTGFSSDSTSTYAFLDRERATLVLQATSLD